jgi:transcriptional regulator with XRE-family HTH domain
MALFTSLHDLAGEELRFMRKFLELTTLELGKKLGVSHPAVLKWEKGSAIMGASQEIYLRMVFLECLKSIEMLTIFEEIKPENLTELKNQSHLSINIKEMRLSA